MTIRSGRSLIFYYSCAPPAQAKGLFELAHDLFEGAAHPVELDIGSAAYAVLVAH
jgi:hypothetical protein